MVFGSAVEAGWGRGSKVCLQSTVAVRSLAFSVQGGGGGWGLGTGGWELYHRTADSAERTILPVWQIRDLQTKISYSQEK